MHSDKIAQAHAQRARQFMPFAALTGYYELVHEQERFTEPRHAIPEEEMDRINRVLATIHPGDMVRVTHYQKDAYVTTTGIVSVFTPQQRTFTVVHTCIRFKDIADIEIIRPRCITQSE